MCGCVCASVFHASVHLHLSLTMWYSLIKLYLSTHALIICDNFHLVLHLYWILSNFRNMYSILIMRLTFPVCCCALLIHDSFIRTRVDFWWFVYYSHVAPTVWEGEVHICYHSSKAQKQELHKTYKTNQHQK